jgi:hypothetical protein
MNLTGTNPAKKLDRTMFWSVAEPIFHYMTPSPMFDVPPETAQIEKMQPVIRKIEIPVGEQESSVKGGPSRMSQ